MVNKNKKIIFLPAAFILLLITTGTLYASPIFINTPQKESTFGRFGSDADDFLSPRNYVNLNFDNLFSVFNFSSRSPRGNWMSNNMAQIGAATWFGNIYVGMYYGGNALQNFGRSGADGNIHNYNIETVDFFSSDKTMRVYDREPVLTIDTRYHWIYNEFAILVGVSDLMGIRLSFGSNHQSLNLTDDFAVDQGGSLEFYKSLSHEFGFLNPELALAFSRELIPGRGIKPEIKADFDFFRHFTKRDRYNDAGEAMGEEITASDNYLDLTLSAGLGGYTLLFVNDFRLGVDLEYLIRMRFYDNEFSYLDENGIYQTARLKGGRIQNFRAREYSYNTLNTHIITPSISAFWSRDKLSLSSRLGLQIRYDTAEVTTMGLRNGNDPNGVLVNNGQNNQTNTLLLVPAIETGMKWEVIENRLFINAGGMISFGRMNFETKNEQNFINGNADDSRTAGRIINNSFTGSSTGLRLGITFRPVKNMEFQAVCGVDSGNSIRLLSVDPGGFFTFSNILGTISF
jgi:hypothetical protein